MFIELIKNYNNLLNTLFSQSLFKVRLILKSSKLNLCRTYWYITRRKKSILLNIAFS